MSEIDPFDELLQSTTRGGAEPLQGTESERETLYNFAFIDEDSKREVRRRLLKAVALPGHLVPFASRDLPIPRYDVPGFNMTERLSLFGAGREKRVYAVPPYTHVAPLEFEDYRFKTEHNPELHCEKCGSNDTYLTSQYLEPETPGTVGRWAYYCSDTSFCQKRAQKDRYISTSDNR